MSLQAARETAVKLFPPLTTKKFSLKSGETLKTDADWIELIDLAREQFKDHPDQAIMVVIHSY
jgi:hypothetical protein